MAEKGFSKLINSLDNWTMKNKNTDIQNRIVHGFRVNYEDAIAILRNLESNNWSRYLNWESHSWKTAQFFTANYPA